VNTLVISTITVAGLAHELRQERDPAAVFIGDPSSGPHNVIVQRQLVGQVPVRSPRRGLAGSLGSSARLADDR
jgi:hypothetical protein